MHKIYLTAVIRLLIILDIRINLKMYLERLNFCHRATPKTFHHLQTFEVGVLQVPESSKKQLEFTNCDRDLQIVTFGITCILSLPSWLHFSSKGLDV